MRRKEEAVLRHLTTTVDARDEKTRKRNVRKRSKPIGEAKKKKGGEIQDRFRKAVRKEIRAVPRANLSEKNRQQKIITKLKKG